MEIRDATETDVESIASCGELPIEAVNTMLRDRTVWIGEAKTAIIAFLAFTVTREGVHITQLGGDSQALQSIISAVIDYAIAGAMPVETVVPKSETAIHELLEEVGFRVSGPGPHFRGEPTQRYRFTPSETDVT